MDALQGNVEATLSGVTVGVYWEWVEVADKKTVAVFRKAVEKMKSLGAIVKEIKIPELEELRVAHVITAVGELATLISADIDKHYHELSITPIMVSAMGSQFSAVESINAMKQRTRTITILETLFKEVDVIATPTTGCPIPRIIPEYHTAHGKVDSKVI